MRGSIIILHSLKFRRLRLFMTALYIYFIRPVFVLEVSLLNNLCQDLFNIPYLKCNGQDFLVSCTSRSFVLLTGL